MNFAQEIKREAMDLGFDLVGITDSAPLDLEHVKLLIGWLKSGFAGQMKYMYRNVEKRVNPGKFLEGARSVICLGLNYTPPRQKPKPADTPSPTGRVATCAQYQDYHLFMKERLRKLIDFIASLTGTNFDFKICVDSAPLAERALAVRAGLGFIGKNHMLINPELGPQIFLGEIVTSLEVEADQPLTDNCSGCNKCVDACLTGALQPDGQFDAGKCISYLTIEYDGHIPPELASKIDDRLFGCDQCVLACPYPEKAPGCKNPDFTHYADRARLSLSELLNLTPESFEAKFADCVIKRSGLERLKRNAQICLENITGRKG